MAIIQYPATSPYFKTKQTTRFLDIWAPRDIPVLNNDKLVTVDAKYQFRPDLLAFDAYQNAKLWWVFAIRNPDDIKDPIFDLKAGMQIFLTEPNDLFELLDA